LTRSVEAGRVTIGDALAAGRRQAGMTVTQVSQRTCIRETIIRGIERDDFSACGGDFYARGHIRSIAQAVSVDPGPLIAEYDATIGAPTVISAADVFQPVTPVRLRERRKPNWTAALALALLVIAGVFAYVQFGAHTAKPVADTKHHSAQTTNANTNAKQGPKAPVGQHQPRRLVIKVTARQNCWVVLTSLKTGRTIFAGMVYAGQSRRWQEKHSVRMQIANPAGVILSVNGSKNRIHRGVKQPINLNLALGQAKS
jgi:cytoskeletal protein RodZ